MKRYAWLLFALGMPLSSPLACGGDGCLRHSDCASGLVCRQGQCRPEFEPAGEGGASDEPSATGGTAASAGTSGGGGKASGGKSGGAGAGSGGANTVAGTSTGAGGEAGERSENGDRAGTTSSGDAGEPTL